MSEPLDLDALESALSLIPWPLIATTDSSAICIRENGVAGTSVLISDQFPPEALSALATAPEQLRLAIQELRAWRALTSPLPAATCGYPLSESSEYGNQGIAFCGASPGHEGQHRALLKWEDSPEDQCAKYGHELGEWLPIPATMNFLSDAQRYWATQPVAVRNCTRCFGYFEHRDADGNAISPNHP